MKNRSIINRFGFALQGLSFALKNEKSFRTEVFLGIGAVIVLLVLRPSPIWWALISLIIATILAAELINTALEALADRLHPEQHPLIARAKDCGAAAVLLLSLSSLMILAALLYNEFVGSR